MSVVNAKCSFLSLQCYHFPHHSCTHSIMCTTNQILNVVVFYTHFSGVNYLFSIAYIILPSCLILSPTTITLVNFLIWCPHLLIKPSKGIQFLSSFYCNTLLFFPPFSMLGLGISRKPIFHVINDPNSQGPMCENGPSF